MKKIEEIFSKLGLSKDNGLFLTKEGYWKKDTSFPNRVRRLIELKIKPDAFFCFDNKPIILFFYNPDNKQRLHEAIWNFNECPIAIIVENDVVDIFNGFKYLKDEKLLERLGGVEKLTDFTYFDLVTGKTWEQYKEQFDYKNRVDYHLLQNIKAARKVLVEQPRLNPKIANAIIGKCIFVRYLIDRKVKMKFDSKLRPWSNHEFCELLTREKEVEQFFNYLEDNERGFNGDLFPLNSDEYRKISNEDYLVIKRLLQGEDIEKNQPSLFEFYDFSIIPIEFISNVYELFIGQENQEKAGAYYTPLFLVDYILKETVEKKLTRKGADYNCKVLDPACGSGIFLVETLRKIIEKYISDTGIEIKSERFKTAIKNLVKENIYGIDKDLSAVQVAIFSIYLTLLDYLEPPGIETFKFPVLFNTNFFAADFFDENLPFNKQLKNIEFDFILGNPPWNRGKGEKVKPLYVEYIDKRRKKEKSKDTHQIDIGNKEIAQAFLLRSSDFSKERTKSSLIVTSKVLYNMQSLSFRKYFLHHFFIERVFELAPVRREVFDKSNDKATAPACVLFFNYANGSNTDSNIIEHISLKPSRFFSLFKIFTINKTDFKTIQQKKLKEFDWLWKVLVYGSYLDFNFLKRLKDDYSTIKETINKDKNLLIGQGVMVGGGDENDASDLVGKPYIDTRSDIRQYWINPDNKKKWEHSIVHRVRDKGLYKAPMLLISGGNNNELKCISALCLVDSIYKSSLTGIKLKNIKLLREISAIINSSFFSYFNIQTFSSTGIEREETHDDEKLITPYSTNKNLQNLVVDTENLLIKKYNSINILSNPTLSASIENNLNEIDSCIYETFSCSLQERDLLEYANQVIIPLAMKHVGYEKFLKPIPIGDNTLENYASLFIDRFKSKLDTDEKKFFVEIWHTNQIIGLFFKMVPTKKYEQEIIWINKQSNVVFLTFLTKIGSEKITDRLFVQKDIRGFEKDYFYIFKPNERQLWHKAIGYLDVNEFADSILKTGRKG
jgi:hypothetical protein